MPLNSMQNAVQFICKLICNSSSLLECVPLTGHLLFWRLMRHNIYVIYCLLSYLPANEPASLLHTCFVRKSLSFHCCISWFESCDVWVCFYFIHCQFIMLCIFADVIFYCRWKTCKPVTLAVTLILGPSLAPDWLR